MRNFWILLLIAIAISLPISGQENQPASSSLLGQENQPASSSLLGRLQKLEEENLALRRQILDMQKQILLLLQQTQTLYQQNLFLLEKLDKKAEVSAKDVSGKSLRIVCGKTVPGATNWGQHDNSGICVDVDTSIANFTSVPYYFTTLGGDGSHWMVQGTTSIYSPTSKSFRVYINQSGITVANAQSWKWHIIWCAIGE